MNNNPAIIVTMKGNPIHVYIQRVSDNASSPLNQYLQEPGHLSEYVSDFLVGWVTHPSTPNVLSVPPIYSWPNHIYIHITPVPVIRDQGYSEGHPEWPSRVWFSPAIHASMFTLCLLSLSPGGSQRPPYILLMQWGHPTAHNHTLPVHLQSHLITALKFTWSCPPCSFPNLLNHCLQVHLQTRWIMASKCITRFTWSPF